jgi:hypothetical protein
VGEAGEAVTEGVVTSGKGIYVGVRGSFASKRVRGGSIDTVTLFEKSLGGARELLPPHLGMEAWIVRWREEPHQKHREQRDLPWSSHRSTDQGVTVGIRGWPLHLRKDSRGVLSVLAEFHDSFRDHRREMSCLKDAAMSCRPWLSPAFTKCGDLLVPTWHLRLPLDISALVTPILLPPSGLLLGQVCAGRRSGGPTKSQAGQV